ncbi:MAG: HEAT repeat domain-containing protein [Kofleriaceae bacterium]
MRRAPLLGLLLATLAHAAPPGPIAAIAADVDGDGREDPITLNANGELSIGGSVAVKLPIAGKARIEAGTWNKKPIIVVVGEKEAFVVEPDGAKKTWKMTAKTTVGGVGLDADYAVDVTATPSGVYRFQTRANLRRCDGKPALLFAEGFNGKVFGRVTRLPIGVDPSATTLAAKLDPSATTPVLYAARFSSHQIGAGDAGGLGIPTELDDGQSQTMWREELSKSSGEGQFFTFEARAPGVAAKHVRIAGAGRTFNRPKRIAIVGATDAYHVEIPDDASGAAFAVELPKPIAGCVTVILEDTYGPDPGQTAISELSVYADGERAGGAEAMLAQIVAAGGETRNAEAVLAKRGAAGASAIEAEILKTKDARARRRLLAVIAKIEDPTAVPMLVRAATEGWVEGDALVDIVRALGRRGMTEELAQLAGNASFALEARIAAAEAIAPTDAKTFALLVDLAGTGPHALRKAVIERLMLATTAQLIEAAQKETEGASAGDLWRAITKHVKATPADRPAALAAMQAALASATDYERRYRLIDGVATLGDATAMRALEAMLRGLPAGTATAALRQVAVAGAASAPRAEGLSLVVNLAKDPDPGVRMAVLSALAGVEVDTASAWHAPDPDGIDRIITAALATDTWPDVRRRAASSLGLRCQRPGPRAALVEAVFGDKNNEVRGDALVALVQCRAQGVTEILAKVWDDTRSPIEIRTRAVALAAMLGDAKLGATLVGKFARWRGEAISAGDDGEAALSLAVSAAPVIAILDAPGAVQALTEALYDEAFPEIVSAAATALGKLGAKCPASAKAKLVEISKSGGDAARAAELAVSGCGGKAR